MLSTIEYQGYTIKAPPGPSEQGDLAPHPTPLQVVSQVDQNLVYTPPPEEQILQRLKGDVPINQLVPGTVTFQCYWDTIFNAIAQDTQVSKSVSYTTGVTTTDSETTTFGLSLGVEGGGLDGIKAALGASFSESETHSVALSQSRTVTETYTAMPGTTVQVWQLHSEYIAEYEKDGKTYRYKLADAGSAEDGLVLALTFPESGS